MLRDDLLTAIEIENDRLRRRVRELEALCGMSFEAPPILMLTGIESRMFGMLVKLPLVRKEAVMLNLYGLRADGEAAGPKIVDVIACKLRRKLKPYDINISTQWGQGYYLAATDKVRARDLLNQFHMEAA